MQGNNNCLINKLSNITLFNLVLGSFDRSIFKKCPFFYTDLNSLNDQTKSVSSCYYTLKPQAEKTLRFGIV